MKVDEGFSMADSRNLPKVDLMMLLQLMRENDNFNVAEIRGAKTLMSSRDAYVESAVGFVQVKRENSICSVKCLITPEHKVRTKPYAAVAIINEVEETIVEARCEDCPASHGGCKHTICFLMWLIKRTEEPPVTSVACYWARPKLADAVTKDKFVLAKEMGQKRKHSTTSSADSIPNLNLFIRECKMRKVKDCLLTNYLTPKETLDKYSIFDLILEFTVNHNGEELTFDNFKRFAELKLTSEARQAIEESTRQQAASKLWHTLRQGRVTASKIHEATKCTTDGVLVKGILGGYKVPETKAIKRGKRLEGEVLKRIEATLKVSVRTCGFFLITPFIGATPDGLCDDFIIEIKCPMNEKTMLNYVKDNVINQKCKAQTQLQMHAAGKKKALFCVADPKFESNQQYHPYWLYYDQLYVQKLLTEGESFWEQFIFKNFLDMARSSS